MYRIYSSEDFIPSELKNKLKEQTEWIQRLESQKKDVTAVSLTIEGPTYKKQHFEWETTAF